MMRKNVLFFIGLGISALAILLCYAYKEIIVYGLLVGLLFISILFSIFWKTKRSLFLGILTGLIIFIIYIIFSVMGDFRKAGKEIQIEHENWEEIASDLKPMTYEQASENKGIQPLPADATNIYSYEVSFFFSSFENLLRFEANRESILQYAKDVMNRYPDAAQYWVEEDINSGSKIGHSSKVSWFNVQDIRNGKMWEYDRPSSKDLDVTHSKVPTYFQYIFVDFDNNVFYLKQAD